MIKLGKLYANEKNTIVRVVATPLFVSNGKNKEIVVYSEVDKTQPSYFARDLKDFEKRYTALPPLKDINLNIKDGQNG